MRSVLGLAAVEVLRQREAVVPMFVKFQDQSYKKYFLLRYLLHRLFSLVWESHRRRFLPVGEARVAHCWCYHCLGHCCFELGLAHWSREQVEQGFGGLV